MSTRRERARLEQQRAKQAQRSRYLIIGGVVVVLIVAAAAIFASGALNPPAPRAIAADASLAQGVCSSVQTFPTLSRDHILPGQSHPPYNSNPPTNGWHWANPQDWGVYTTPQTQEQLVHNLEHGGVVIQYNNLSATDIQRLTDLVQRDSHHMILAPYPGLPSDVRVAMTAWDHLQTCAGVDENAIHTFTASFRDKGPEFVP